ncbi:MAG: membrane dipeptidase [Ktedonobacterales bacterium]
MTPAFIVDAHEDIGINATHHDRDVRRPVAETRARERAQAATQPDNLGAMSAHMNDTVMIGLPELRRGGVGLVCATIFVTPQPQEQLVADAEAQLRYYQQIARDPDGPRLITTAADLDALTHDWQAAATPEERPVGFLLLMEGADPLTTPAALEEWYRQGLRIVGPAWMATRYAGGTHAPGPLTDLGRELLGEMQRLGMMLDQSHMAEESFWQALDVFSGTVIASHANCREYVPTDRQLTDDMIRAIAERDGVIGAVLHNQFLVANWKPDTHEPVGLDAIVRHIDHICQLLGTARHCGIGSDFDGGAGVEHTPAPFDTVADLGKIGAALLAAGYSDDDVRGILGENWLRVFRRALPTA